MKFSEMPYQLPNFEAVKQELKNVHNKFVESKDEQTALLYSDEYIQLRNHYESMNTICYLKFYKDMTSELYKGDFMQFQQYNADIDQLNIEQEVAMLHSPFRQALESKYGNRMMEIIKFQEKQNQPEASPLKQKDQELCTEYNELTSNVQYEIDGKTYNQMGLMKLMASEDRAIRKKTALKVSEFFNNNKVKIGASFNEMIQLRNQIAKKSGFENYAEYSFIVFSREGYGQKEISNFRNAVAKYFAPVVETMKTIKRTNTGIEHLKYYDTVSFADGGAKIIEDNALKMQFAQKMYDQISPETSRFFEYMTKSELFDIENAPGKMGGGFATWILDHKVPFIFTSFTHTDFDFMVLTHEFGHAFQMSYGLMGKSYKTVTPTIDCVEVYSHAMEFFTLDYAEPFFEKDAPKYVLNALQRAYSTLLSCSMSDEFQQVIYENENFSDEERNQSYLNLLKKYNLNQDYEDNQYLIEGNKWKENAHIITLPFYNIDYALAIVIATQLYKLSKENPASAWKKYMLLCEQCTELNLLKMVEISGLKSPFEEETIKELAEFLNSELLEAQNKYTTSSKTNPA